MDEYNEIRNLVEETMAEITPNVNERSWVMDYLYRHKVGDRLPRGKRFDFFRAIENKLSWSKAIDESQWDLVSSKYTKRISPLLLSQMTIMRYACINNDCNLRTGEVLNVIRNLEGDENSTVPNSTKMTKNEIVFKLDGLLADYEHSHVALLPNAYLKMQSKPKNIRSNANQLINSGVVNLNINDKEVLSTKPDNQGRRQTGHWLITKKVKGVLYYLGVFPHSFKGHDDVWIYKKLQEGK